MRQHTKLQRSDIIIERRLKNKPKLQRSDIIIAGIIIEKICINTQSSRGPTS
jgi:hypothetical protein